MTTIELGLLAVLVTLTMGAVDFAHARYALAMMRVRRGEHQALHVAARWSVVQWGAASIGFIVSVKVSMWLLPFEGLGLYLGTMLGGRRGSPAVEREEQRDSTAD